MLFRKKIEHACMYCSHCTVLDDQQVLCTKRGLMPITGKCRKFIYDPVKRVPPKPKALDFEKYNKEDYSL